MDVRVHKTGQHELAAHIDFDLAAVILTHAGDQSIGYGDVPVAELVAEHVDIGGIFQHQIRLCTTGGHLDHMQLFVELSVDLARIAFLVCHTQFLLISSKILSVQKYFK